MRNKSKLSEKISIPVMPVMSGTAHIYTMALSESQAKAEGRSTKGKYFHDLGWDFVKNLPRIANDPRMIIKSRSDPNDASFAVVTNQFDNMGRPVIIAFSPAGTGKHFNMQILDVGMLTAYGKEDFSQYLASAKTENRILYVKKKSAEQDHCRSPFLREPSVH